MQRISASEWPGWVETRLSGDTYRVEGRRIGRKRSGLSGRSPEKVIESLLMSVQNEKRALRICYEGPASLGFWRKRNKTTLPDLFSLWNIESAKKADVLVTQHAKWTARRIRRALFGQSLIDFSGSSWTCVKIHKSSTVEPTQVNRRKAQVSRITRAFSQAAEVDAQPRQHTTNCQSLVPGMSQYGDSQNIFEDSHVDHVGSEDFLDATEVPQRIEFFVLSP